MESQYAVTRPKAPTNHDGVAPDYSAKTCLRACTLIYLRACPLVCLCACTSVCLRACSLVYLCTCTPVCLWSVHPLVCLAPLQVLRRAQTESGGPGGSRRLGRMATKRGKSIFCDTPKCNLKQRRRNAGLFR